MNYVTMKLYEQTRHALRQLHVLLNGESMAKIVHRLVMAELKRLNK